MTWEFLVSDFAVAAGETPLLAKLAFSVKPGELLGLTGPSGCGKSTLLRAFAGLIDAAAGDMHLDRQTPAEIGWPEYRRRVVLVAQQPVLLEGSVRRSLERPFLYRSAREPFPEEKAASLLTRLGVGADKLGQEGRSLSVGEQQRVCVIRALLLRPKVLLFDEPTSALDNEHVALVESFIREATGQGGTAALVVTHDEGQAERLCDRRIHLREFMCGSASGGGTP